MRENPNSRIAVLRSASTPAGGFSFCLRHRARYLRFAPARCKKENAARQFLTAHEAVSRVQSLNFTASTTKTPSPSAPKFHSVFFY
jgi:hypothetical protein